MVPPYYEHLARVHFGKTLEEWAAMNRWDKALVVATYGIENSIQAHQAQAEIKRAQQQTSTTAN